MAEKQDRRIRKTKAQLRHGLARLMQKKSIKEITVKELVEEVDINRSTFYLHYTDIYDLLEKTELELKDELMNIISNEEPVPIEATMPHITALFTFVADNRDIASALLGPNGDVAFISHIEQIIAGHCMDFLRPYMADSDSDRLGFANAFCITGCVGLIIDWMKHDFRETPEAMAKMAYTLVLSALRPYMTDAAARQLMPKNS